MRWRKMLHACFKLIFCRAFCRASPVFCILFDFPKAKKVPESLYFQAFRHPCQKSMRQDLNLRPLRLMTNVFMGFARAKYIKLK